MHYDSDVAVKRYIEKVRRPEELPDEFITISVASLNDTNEKEYPKWKILPLYKTDERGIERVWQIGFDGISIWILHGPLTGTNIDTKEIVLNESGRSMQAQAKLECNNLYTLKYRAGYRILEDERPINVKLMKGKPYEEGCIKPGDFPVIVDLKLDGIRMSSSYDSNKLVLKSYNNVPFNHITHFRSQIDDFMSYLPSPSRSVIDGELYNHSMNLREINSAVRADVNISKELERICYYIFDIYWEENPPTEDRYTVYAKAYMCYLKNRDKKSPIWIRYLPKFYAYSHEELIKYRDMAVEDGFEGIVIRRSKYDRNGRVKVGKPLEMTQYHFGRSVRLYKFKPWYDDEAPIVGIEDTKGKEKDLCKVVVKLDNGKRLAIRYGSAEEKRMWKADPYLIIGHILEYEYPEINEDTGIPQQPRGKRIRYNYN